MATPPSLLSTGNDRIGLHLFIFGLLSFVASAMAILLAAGGQFAGELGERLQGSATVVVHSAALESADAAAARANEIIASSRDVARVWTLESHPSDVWIASLIEGKPPSPSQASPLLIAVTLRHGSAPDALGLRNRLLADHLSASVDDHRLWTSRLWRAIATLLALAAATWLILLGGAFALIGAATRRCLMRRHELVHLLCLSGASDGFITNLFRIRLGKRAAVTAISGATVAVVAAAAWRFTAATDIAWEDLAAAICWPAVAVAVALGAVSISTRAALKHQP